MSAGSNSALRICALLAGALLSIISTAALGDVCVGDAGQGRVKIEAHDASVGEVLEALKASHLIEFRASKALSRVVTGTYSGTLSQVLSRLLAGYNYFLQVTASGTQLNFLDAAREDRASLGSSFATMADHARPVSSNVDADDERAMKANAPAPPVAISPSLQPPPAAARTAVQSAGARGSGSARISTNVDLDEESIADQAHARSYGVR